MTAKDKNAPTELTWVKAQLPVSLADALKRRADASERSVSGEVRVAIKAHLGDDESVAA